MLVPVDPFSPRLKMTSQSQAHIVITASKLTIGLTGAARTANKCYNCGKMGHCMRDCQAKKKWKPKKKANDKGKGKSTGDQMNMVEEEVTFVIDEEAYNLICMRCTVSVQSMNI
jgi:Zinc knuckle